MKDTIYRQVAIEAIENIDPSIAWLDYAADVIKALPSAQPETCEGCRHLDKWENEVEYGYLSPCTCCKRRVEDHYER